MRLKPFLIAAFCAISVVAVAAATYAIRARDSAIRGWGVAANVQAELARSQAEMARLNVRDKGRNNYEQAFKWMVAKNAGINPNDSSDVIAEKLTRHIYSETPFVFPYVETTNDPLRYLLTIDKATFNYCSSLSATLGWALDLFRIKTRIVHVAGRSFFEGSEGDTHTFIEAMVDGRPVVYDPTFNTTYSCGHKRGPVDAKSMFECVTAGIPIKPRYLSPPRPGRSLAEYYIPLDKLFYAIDASRGASAGFYAFEQPSPGWLTDVRSKHVAK